MTMTNHEQVIRTMCQFDLNTPFGFNHPILNYEVICEETGWRKNYKLKSNKDYNECIDELINRGHFNHALKVKQNYANDIMNEMFD